MQALGQVQLDSGKKSEGSGEGLGGFGAEFTERSNSIGFRNSGENLGGFGADPGQIQYYVESSQVQQGTGKGSDKGLGILV